MIRFLRAAAFAVFVVSAGMAAAAAIPALRIMPLGDSITEGARGYASYRYWLEKDLDGIGLAFDFVGSRHGVYGGEPRFADFDQDHEGHWGWTTGKVLGRIDGWAAAAKPDVVLMHLGSNDLGSQPEIIPTNLARIIASLRRANPRVAVFVARLIPVLNFSPDTLERVNAAIDRMGHEQSSAESPVVVVPQDAGFDARQDTYDGIHPNESGEKKMAARWFEALRSAHLR